eukprot:gene1770-539_t
MSEIKLDNHFALTAIGKVCSGKSTFLNTCIGTDFFKTGISTEKQSITEKTHIKENHWFNDTKEPLVTCIDTPGLLDEEKVTKLGGKNYLAENIHTLIREAAIGLNCFVLTFNIQNIHFDNQTQGILDLLERIFGEGFWKHVLIVFTFCDEDKKQEWEKVQKKINEDFVKEIKSKFHFLKNDLEICYSGKDKDGKINLKSIQEKILKFDKFDCSFTKEVRKLEMEKSEKEVDKFIDESIVKSIFDMTSCKLL